MSEIVQQQNSPWRRILGLESPQPVGIRDRHSLLAASQRITSRRIQRGQIAPEAWQQEAIELYSEVGELRYVANATANAASRADMFVARFEDETSEPVRVEDPLVNAMFDAFGGGDLSRSELVKRLFVQLFVPGDGFVVGLPPGVLDNRTPTPPELTRMSDLSWHVMAATEVTITQGRLTLNLGDKPITIEQERAVIVRAWRPNPFRWWQADSPVRSNLPVLRELVGLTKHVSANIDSRLAGAGLLLIGDSFSLLAGQSPDADDTPESDPVMAALMDAMLTAIKDRDSAAAVMPIILQGPDEAIDKVRHVTFATPFDATTKELRDEAIRRLALGLDAPPEVLLGLGTSTHWNAWIIQDDTVRTHIDPALALICDALTTDYLWPMLEDHNVENPHDYVVTFDTSRLTQRADRSQEAIALFDRGAMTAESLRRETGFDETDAPPDSEVDEAVKTALRLVESTPALLTDPGLPAVIAQIRGALGIEGETVELEPVAPAGVEPEPAEEAVDANDMPDTLEEPDGLAAATYQPDLTDAPGGGLPDNYRPALSEDVPEGRACGNCLFYDETQVSEDGEQAWCLWWEDWVRGDFYCNAWAEQHEETEGDNGDGDG